MLKKTQNSFSDFTLDINSIIEKSESFSLRKHRGAV